VQTEEVDGGRSTSLASLTTELKERERLVADGLAVPCELAAQHGGWGLRYATNAPELLLPPGTALGVYPGHAGMRPSWWHVQLPELVAGAPRGEYAFELRNRILYAKRGRRSAGAINEHCWPNVKFIPVDMDIDNTDEPLTSFLLLVTTRQIRPGEFLGVDYGPDYEEVRRVKGYAVEQRIGPPTRPLNLTQYALELAMHRAFSRDELRRLRSIAGVVDFKGVAGARGDPNRYRGAPPRPPGVQQRGPDERGDTQQQPQLQRAAQRSWQRRVSPQQAKSNSCSFTPATSQRHTHAPLHAPLHARFAPCPGCPHPCSSNPSVHFMMHFVMHRSRHIHAPNACAMHLVWHMMDRKGGRRQVGADKACRQTQCAFGMKWESAHAATLAVADVEPSAPGQQAAAAQRERATPCSL